MSYTLPGVGIEVDCAEVFFEKPNRDDFILKSQGMVALVGELDARCHVVLVLLGRSAES
jgi:hypothetical protein